VIWRKEIFLIMQISDLLTLVKKPALYGKGNASMWEDEYISGRLLELHLDPDCDAASRRRSTIERTVQWIGRYLDDTQRSVLDLGCGPGLYANDWQNMGTG
jgi:hypothetical protein